MQDPDLAIAELDRASTRSLQGRARERLLAGRRRENPVYYDLDRYWPFWAKVEQLDVPFYLHRGNPLAQDSRIYEGHEWLLGPTWRSARRPPSTRCV